MKKKIILNLIAKFFFNLFKNVFKFNYFLYNVSNKITLIARLAVGSD